MKNNYFFKKSYSNIYKSSSRSSEVTSQILYGEKFTILSKNKKWIKIKSAYDDYIGYIKSGKFLNSHKITHKVSIKKANIFDKSNNKTKFFLPFASRISIIQENKRFIEAPAAVFRTQEAVKEAFQAGKLNRDVIVVVRYQGPSANGMPELHNLTPFLSVLSDRGFKVALVTDGRMSGASGKVLAAIHLSPEAATNGAIAKIQDGDILRLDANLGKLENLAHNWLAREIIHPNLSENNSGLGREGGFRALEFFTEPKNVCIKY